jgi:uncharacterized protein involved in exopolysaccharide biosynthesis
MISYPLLWFILSHKKINIIIFSLYCILIFILVVFVISLKYTAQVSILPSQANFAQGFGGKMDEIKKAAGLTSGPLTAQSQEMYLGILHSRRLLDQCINKEFEINYRGMRLKKKLVDFLEIEGENEREVHEKMIKTLREDIQFIEIDTDNEILYLDVTTDFPELSAQLANYMVDVLNEIVKNQVQKEYREQYQYLQNRILEIEDSLRIADNEMQNFLEKNFDPNLPQFQVEKIRYMRNIEVQTVIYTEFKAQLELFIADNMINLSDIKILDSAIPPYRKSRPKRALLLVSFGILCLFIQISVNGTIIVYRRFRRNFAEMEVDAL